MEKNDSYILFIVLPIFVYIVAVIFSISKNIYFSPVLMYSFLKADSSNVLTIQLFRQRLSHKSVKAYATMPIGIMGRKSLALID